MNVIHTIRLRDPWDSQPLPDGSTEYRRRFGQPRLGLGESVWLVCPENSKVQLNGEAIACEGEVTTRLLPRNEVVIVSSVPLSDVRLEIRSE